MNRIVGMVMAVGLVIGHASVADAQVFLSIGDPYTDSGVQIGQPYGYGLGGGGTTYYRSGYSSYVAPGTSSFVTGSYASAPYVYGAPAAYGLAPAVVVPYRTYGYRDYRRGLRVPFLGRRGW